MSEQPTSELTVYVLMVYTCSDGDYIEGVFATREAAEAAKTEGETQAKKKRRCRHDDFVITEHEVIGSNVSHTAPYHG